MSFLAMLGAIAGGISAIAIIGGAGLWVGRKMSPLLQMADDWRGEPERKGPGGVVVAPARMSVMERLAALEGGMAEVKKELKPNSGSTFRDAVDRAVKAAGAPAAVPDVPLSE
jgi:hypothetical protein